MTKDILYDEEYHKSRHGIFLRDPKKIYQKQQEAEEKIWTHLRGVNGKVLEIGCGLGENIMAHPNTTGIDISEFIVSEARKRGVNALVMDAKNLKFKNKEFSGIIMSHMLEHFENPAIILKNVHKLLKKNGRLVICVPNPYFMQDKTHLYCWRPETLKNLLGQCGFKVINWEWYAKTNLYTKKFVYEVGYRLLKILTHLFSVPNFLQFTIVAIKT